MSCQDTPYPRTAKVLGFLEALSGLPVDIHFIRFAEAKEGKLKEFDVVFNAGNASTSFTGDTCWRDPNLVSAVREYISDGGGFIGIGDPTAVEYGGRFFQLADALGVDKELSKSMLYNRYNNKPVKEHFIMADVMGTIDYADGDEHIYALDGTQILDGLPTRMDNYHVKLSANEYCQGRTVYIAGLGYNAQNSRLLYRAMLWCAKKEKELYKAFSTNIWVECNYYPAMDKYCLVNNSDKEQATVFYDINSEKKQVNIKANELIWF